MKGHAMSVFVALALLTSATLGAQTSRSAPRTSSPTPSSSAPPPVVLPFPPLMSPPAGGLTSGFPFEPDPTRPVHDLYRAGGRSDLRAPRADGPSIGGFGGYGGYPVLGEAVAPSRASGVAPASGMLRLSATPSSAQAFVDSYYVGTVEDIETKRVLTLPAGPHRIELRAPGYEALTFDVRIDPNDTITYRGALERLRPAVVTAPVASAAAKRVYVVPNCYLGNVPPRQERLPAGCSAANVKIIGGN